MDKKLINIGKISKIKTNILFKIISKEIYKKTGLEIKLKLYKKFDVDLIEMLFNIESKIFRKEIVDSKKDLLEKLTKHEDTLLIILFYLDRPIGFRLAHLSNYFDNNTYFLDVFGILPEFQKKNIGPLILIMSYFFAKKLGYKFVGIHCEKENKQKVNLPKYYEKQGFSLYKNGGRDDKWYLVNLNSEKIKKFLKIFEDC